MPPEIKRTAGFEVNEKRLGKSKASLEIYIVRDQISSQRFISSNLRQQIKYRFSPPIGQAPNYAPIWWRHFGVDNLYSFTRNTQSKPQAQPQAAIRLTCLGFFSMLWTSSPCIEPGDLPFLMEAMPFTDCFSLEKQTVPARPPIGRPACRRSLSRSLS